MSSSPRYEPACCEPAEQREPDAGVNQVDDHARRWIEPELAQLAGFAGVDTVAEFPRDSRDRGELPGEPDDDDPDHPARATQHHHPDAGQADRDRDIGQCSTCLAVRDGEDQRGDGQPDAGKHEPGHADRQRPMERTPVSPEHRLNRVTQRHVAARIEPYNSQSSARHSSVQ
jgi:hypothetical protein